MARIDGPKTTSPGQILRTPLEPLPVTSSSPSAASPKNEAPDSDFVDPGKKLISTTGAFRPVPIPDALRGDLKSFVAGQLRGGVSAKPSGNSLSIKAGEARGATKAATPQALEKELAKKPMNELTGRISMLSEGEKAALGKAIQSGKVTNPRVIAGFLEFQVPAERAKSMAKLPARQLEQLKTLMRAGDCPDNVAVGVGLRLAAESKWAKANPEVVKTLQAAYANGTIRVANSDADIAGLGMTSETGIDLANQLRKSPEALAATIAHEGVHMHSGSGCCSGNYDATPAGEFDGMAASADVWGQLGNKKDPNLSARSLSLLNEAAAAKSNPNAKGDDGLKGKVLGWYTNFYQVKRDNLTAQVAKAEKKFETTKHPDDRAELDALKTKLNYATNTAETFRVAWKANG